MSQIFVLLCMVVGSLAEWIPDWIAPNKPLEALSGSKFPLLSESPKEIFSPIISLKNSSGNTMTTTRTTTEGKSKVEASTVLPSITTSTPKPSQPCTSMFSCADCNTAQVCRPSSSGLIPAFTLPCPNSSPYCNSASGTCSTVPDSHCGSLDSFICLENGNFPDPVNCTIYHFCNNTLAHKFQCAEGQKYDPIMEKCTIWADCSFNVNCTGWNQVKLTMGQTKYFTYCSGGYPIVVSRCPGDYKLNTTSQVCEPICEQDGLMADLEDCSKFYQCTTLYINTNLSVPIRQNLPCPPGEAFEPSSYQCIPKNATTCKM